MDYAIHIQKMTDLQDELILHYASRDSVSLRWLGGDNLEPGIIGSELNFDLEVGDGADGAYDQYFTSNEQLWRVTKVIHQTNEVVWQGYLLPESYTEPWDNPLYYVKFSAVDGLGLLKGKKLPAAYYSEEKNVLEFISACLKLTGLNFDIFLAPAIRNQLKKKWHEIIHDGLHWADEDGNASAYDILDALVKSMQCQLYQADETWYLEGINKRQFIEAEYDVYSIEGVYQNTVTRTKNIKQLTYLPTPNITIVPPFKEVVVTHEAAQLEFPKGVAQEQEVSWNVSPNAQYNFYYSRFWTYNDYRPEVKVEDDYLFLANYNQSSTFNENRKVELRDKPYILKAWRVNIHIEIELNFTEDVVSPSDSLIEKWIDLAIFRITLGNTVLFFNKNSTELSPERLIFNSSGKAEADLTFVAQENGLLNVELFEPTNDVSGTKVSAFKLTDLSVENVNQRSNDVYTASVDENASKKQDIELEISDDVSALSKSFYLEKVRDLTPVGQEKIFINYLDFYTENQYNIFVLSIRDAKLLDDYRSQAFYNTVEGGISESLDFPLENYEVIYNYLGSELMVLKVLETETTYFPSRFAVKVQKIKPTTIERTKWLEWTDAIYQLEKKPYGQVVAEIQQKLNKKQFLRIEATVDKPVKFNDIIRFKYQGVFKYFTVTNCEWMPDDNTSSITMVENVYNGKPYGNLLPYVDAGEDKLLYTNPFDEIETIITPLTLNGYAFAPTSVINSILWEKVTGPPGDQILNEDTLTPTINNLTGDYYVYKITVTDSRGAVVTDTMEINRAIGHKITFLPVEDDWHTIGLLYKDVVKKWKIIPDPEIGEDYSFNLKFEFLQEYNSEGSGIVEILVEKNNQSYKWRVEKSAYGSNEFSKEFSEIFNFRKNDEFYVRIYTEVQVVNNSMLPANALGQFKITEFSQASGYSNVVQLPYAKTVNAQI